MSEARQQLLIAAVAFYSIAASTWVFSSRRKLFVRVFTPRHELKPILRRGGLRKRDEQRFKQGMRFIAGLQAVFATLLVIALCYFVA